MGRGPQTPLVEARVSRLEVGARGWRLDGKRLDEGSQVPHRLGQGGKRGVPAGVGRPSIIVSLEQRQVRGLALDELLWGQLRVRCDRFCTASDFGSMVAGSLSTHCPRCSHRAI